MHHTLADPALPTAHPRVAPSSHSGRKEALHPCSPSRSPGSPWSTCGEAPRAARPPGQPVIALHASGSSARQWRGLAESLEPLGTSGTTGMPARAAHGAERGPLHPGYRVLALDLHDHGVGPSWIAGAGGEGRTPLTLEDEAALVAPLLAEAGRVADGGGAHLVGHSYGAAVALKVASQHAPSLRSLVLYEPVAFRVLLDDPASHAETQEALSVTHMVRARLEHGDAEGAAQHFVDYWSGSGTWQAMPAPARAAIAERMPSVLQHFGALANERQQVAAISRFAAAGVPTLVISGERTVATARRIARRLRTLLPRALHETLPGLGHMAPITHAGQVNARIADFLHSLRPPISFPQPPGPQLRDLLSVD